MGPRMPAGARREAILRAAMDLFARRGFAGVTTRELARAAGISEAMLFKHFPRKESLYRAILERHLHEMEEVLPLAGIAASREPPERLLVGVALTILRRVDEDPTLLRLMFYSALEGHPMAREVERSRARGFRGAIESYMRRMFREGALRRTDPSVAARSFVWLVVGYGISRVLFREPGARAYPRAALARRIVGQFLDGLRPAGAGARRKAS